MYLPITPELRRTNVKSSHSMHLTASMQEHEMLTLQRLLRAVCMYCTRQEATTNLRVLISTTCREGNTDDP
jgi:hypothetical protein